MTETPAHHEAKLSWHYCLPVTFTLICCSFSFMGAVVAATEHFDISPQGVYFVMQSDCVPDPSSATGYSQHSDARLLVENPLLWRQRGVTVTGSTDVFACTPPQPQP